MSDAAVQTRPVGSIMNCDRQRIPIRLCQPIATVSKQLLQETSTISNEISDDIVQWSIGRGSKVPANEYVKTMRRMVEEVLEKHCSLFRGLVMRFNTANLNVLESVTTIADEEFGDGEANWGRIVALCAFVSRLARHLQQNGMESQADQLTHFLRDYFNDRLNCWIATQGGWNHFTRRFQSSSLEPKIFKGLLATGLALGVLAGVVAFR